MDWKSFILGVVMDWKSFILGVVIVGLIKCIIEMAKSLIKYNKRYKNSQMHWLKEPVNYEHKGSITLKVFYIYNDKNPEGYYMALANEVSDYDEDLLINRDKVIMILSRDEDFYDAQIVKIPNPQRVANFIYKNMDGNNKTCPVIKKLF